MHQAIGRFICPLPLHPSHRKSPRTSHGHGFFIQLKRTYKKAKTHVSEKRKNGMKRKAKRKASNETKKEKKKHYIILYFILYSLLYIFLLFLHCVIFSI